MAKFVLNVVVLFQLAPRARAKFGYVILKAGSRVQKDSAPQHWVRDQMYEETKRAGVQKDVVEF